MYEAGRLGTLEIVIDDSSVSRRHAEFGSRTAAGGCAISAPTEHMSTGFDSDRASVGCTRDIVQFGKVAMMVRCRKPPHESQRPTSSAEQIIVEAGRALPGERYERHCSTATFASSGVS
jgi:hypothetical protein